MFFGQGDNGWTETWYATKSGPGQALEDLAIPARRRIGLLGEQSKLRLTRVSDVAIKGDSLVSDLDTTDISRMTPDAPDPSDVVYTGWLVRFEAGSNYRRELILRGAPDSFYIDPPGVSPIAVQPSATMRKALQTFFTILRASGWGLYVVDKSGANPTVRINNVVQAAAPFASYWQVTAPTLGAVVGDQVKVYGSASAVGLRGTWRVLAVAGDSYTLTAKWATSGPYLMDGTIKRVVKVIATLTDYHIERCVKRNTGRSFFVTRGRRKKATQPR